MREDHPLDLNAGAVGPDRSLFWNSDGVGPSMERQPCLATVQRKSELCCVLPVVVALCMQDLCHFGDVPDMID